MKFQHAFVPWPVSENADKKIIEEILERVLYIEEEFDFANLDIKDFYENFTIPRFSSVKPVIMKKIHVPDSITEELSIDFSIPNDLIDKICNSKKNGILDCEIILVPNPVQKDKKSVPRCPYMMLAHTSKDKLLMNPMVENLEDKSSEMITAFAESIIKNKEIPSKIYVRDKRTYSFLEKFCELTDIKLEEKIDIPVLDEIYIDLCDHLGVNTGRSSPIQDAMMEQMIQMLSEMSMNELRALPKDMIKFAKSLVGTGIFPPAVEIKLANV